MSVPELAPLVNRVVEGCAEDLYKLSRFLCENPELALQEFKAHDRLCEFLEHRGFAVKRQHLLETAFRAEFHAPGGSNANLSHLPYNPSTPPATLPGPDPLPSASTPYHTDCDKKYHYLEEKLTQIEASFTATIASTIVTTVTETVAWLLEPLAARLTNLKHIIAELTPVTEEQSERIVHLEKPCPLPIKSHGNYFSGHPTFRPA
ncbi:hypothetical protein HPB48_007840 [Haemaphysalis longicornis]|uniref:Uncharacterized protein n=1 Tax=Haemaphysalis longicornis TaxID=44386 RepID=A0A9J6GLA7_HAELO|nr:hypothetical protein HPB48_007840 [Haemaphysalis longicornis]